MVANAILHAQLSICPVLVTLPLPSGFCSCLPVTLKAPCCPKHLKIHVVCSKQADSSAWYPVWWTKVYISVGGKTGCIVSCERGVPVFNTAYTWEIFSRAFWLRGIFFLIALRRWANPISQIDLRGRLRTEMGRRMTCPPWHPSVSLIFGPEAQSRRWKAEQMIPSLPDQPHLLSVLWVLRAG